MVRCTAQLVKGVDVDGPLAMQLLELNGHLRFGAFAWDPDEQTVLFTHTILGGTTLDPEELMATLRDVALIADEYDDKLMKKYGGQRMIDLLEEAAMERIMDKDPSQLHVRASERRWPATTIRRCGFGTRAIHAGQRPDPDHRRGDDADLLHVDLRAGRRPASTRASSTRARTT